MPPQSPQQPMGPPQQPMGPPPEQPVQFQPVGPPTNPNTAQVPPPNYYGPTPMVAEMPQAPKKRSRAGIIILILVLVAALLAGGAYMLFGRSRSGALPVTSLDAVKSVSGTSTAADIASLDKTEAFWAYFKNAAEQQKVVVTKVQYALMNGSDPAAATQKFSKAGMDYATKKYVIAEEEQLRGEADSHVRCYDGKSFLPKGTLERWSEYDSSDPISPCIFNSQMDKFNDGVNTSGLTPDQAQEFVGNLRSVEGLVAVKDLQLEQHNGKPYLHFTVALALTAKPGGVLKFGGLWLTSAFKAAGLNPDTHPYGRIAADGQGFRFEYFVDPATKLPAYSEVVLDSDNPNAQAAYIYKTRYQFGTATFDARTSNHDPITFDW